MAEDPPVNVQPNFAARCTVLLHESEAYFACVSEVLESSAIQQTDTRREQESTDNALTQFRLDGEAAWRAGRCAELRREISFQNQRCIRSANPDCNSAVENLPEQCGERGHPRCAVFKNEKPILRDVFRDWRRQNPNIECDDISFR